MAQANTPSEHDGRMAFWVDGKLAADFPGVRFRDTEDLKANLINISFYTENRRVRGGEMWYDDVVAATSYIGPMVDEKNQCRPLGMRHRRWMRPGCALPCGACEREHP